jgi:hypothetical protein
MPAAGDPRYSDLIAAIERVFADYHVAERVVLEYDTEVYWARLA